MVCNKRRRTSTTTAAGIHDLFDDLPDDLLVLLLGKLSANASSPSDLVNVMLTCKRFNRLALHPMVLSKAGPKAFEIRIKNWCESTHRFLKLCVSAGNVEACYTLGMVEFYCMKNRGNGASLMAKAAIKSHPLALYSLAIVQFNGSGGSKSDKNLRAGVALCGRAACLGHIDALRELGHCLQDGYGVAQNASEGRRLLIEANARELASITNSSLRRLNCSVDRPSTTDSSGSLLSDFGYNIPAPEVHPANQFLRDWFTSGRGFIAEGLRLCSNSGCGRPETRLHEFRRCSVCGNVNYCSRGCQALDWKLQHKTECAPFDRWLIEDDDLEDDDDDGVNRIEQFGDGVNVETE
ncbi:F-box protein At5g50450-like [Cucurbita maxima]|uniref:F-box protein At5g50450-like n=1 Tax=Cucurbita maxima TaxID=3661 RepID=A0A6J1JZ31_CUCMA|nr:F-box protein At5g50450-like [Cucurbita maxima]